MCWGSQVLSCIQLGGWIEKLDWTRCRNEKQCRKLFLKILYFLLLAVYFLSNYLGDTLHCVTITYMFQVLRSEVSAIRRACASLQQGYEPSVTFLVVQKRHHTRFFPMSKEDEDGKNRNVPAGTVVDTKITHPTELDFFLASHASIQV